MSSPFRRPEIPALALGLLIALTGCERETREVRGGPAGERQPGEITLSDLGSASSPTSVRAMDYEGNAFHLNEGQRLFKWYNCNGCHANGGGAIGPPLMDDTWRYGGDLEHIRASIVQGRPNGMPSFRDKIPEAQVWQIAAYVRSLSGNVPKDAASSRSDSISGPPAWTQYDPQPPRTGERSSVQGTEP
jgi:cytochrome c oxidase cbb3-type subunit 3